MKRSTNGFKIEKGVPVPSRFRRTGYPWSVMKPGDSVLIPSKHKNPDVAALNWGRLHGRKFTTHREANGYRIWRVT